MRPGRWVERTPQLLGASQPAETEDRKPPEVVFISRRRAALRRRDLVTDQADNRTSPGDDGADVAPPQPRELVLGLAREEVAPVETAMAQMAHRHPSRAVSALITWRRMVSLPLR